MNMKNCKRININDNVIVELDSVGLKKLCTYYGVSDEQALKKTFKNRVNLKTMAFEAPLGEFMSIFGQDYYVGGHAFFKDGYINIPMTNLK